MRKVECIHLLIFSLIGVAHSYSQCRYHDPHTRQDYNLNYLVNQ